MFTLCNVYMFCILTKKINLEESHQHDSVVIVSKYSLSLFTFPLQLTDISCTSNHCCFHLLYNRCYIVLEGVATVVDLQV